MILKGHFKDIFLRSWTINNTLGSTLCPLILANTVCSTFKYESKKYEGFQQKDECNTIKLCF